MIYEFDGLKPVIHPSAYVHEQANVTGNVFIGKDVYIGPGAVLRGDWGKIVIEDGCNVQENCVIHMFPGKTVTLKKGAHVGHGAIVHGGTLGENCLIGMNAVIMDDVSIGDESIVGALAFVAANSEFEKRSLIVGNPAKKIKEVSDSMIGWKTQGTALYQQLPQDCRDSLKPCEPLTEPEPNRKDQPNVYDTWNDTK
jgi:carbonic anhydrase/acetyltransferase-like protein (isoleucine patch superfamily)